MFVIHGYTLLTHFQCDMCHLCNTQGGYLVNQIMDYEQLLATIRCSSLDEFRSQEPVTVLCNLPMICNLRKTAK